MLEKAYKHGALTKGNVNKRGYNKFFASQCNVSQAVRGEHKRIGTSKKYTVNYWLESIDYF